MAQDLDTITEQDSLLISNKQLLQQLEDQQAAITSAVERLEQTLEGMWPGQLIYHIMSTNFLRCISWVSKYISLFHG